VGGDRTTEGKAPNSAWAEFRPGQARGYRKALRVMHLAANLDGRYFTFCDTRGRSGIDAEERGQAGPSRAPSRMARLPVPIVVTITGEGAQAVRWRLLWGIAVNMLENSGIRYFPGGLRVDFWRDSGSGNAGGSAQDHGAGFSQLGIMMKLVPEPEEGAHLDHEGSAALLDSVLDRSLRDLLELTSPRAGRTTLRKNSPHGAVLQEVRR